jgi:hypothetical protein
MITNKEKYFRISYYVIIVIESILFISLVLIVFPILSVNLTGSENNGVLYFQMVKLNLKTITPIILLTLIITPVVEFIRRRIKKLCKFI